MYKKTATVAMHVKKTWKNAVVMLLAVAAVTTAAFYFNYAATEATACCAVAQSSSSMQLSEQQTNSAVAAAAAAAAAAAVEPNRGKFGSTVLHASRLYAVCKTHDYHRSRSADRVSTNFIIKNRNI